MSLLDYYRGLISPRRLSALLQWLPEGSALAACLSFEAPEQPRRQIAPHVREWFGHTRDRELLMAVVDALLNQTVVIAKANSGKRGRGIKAPKPIDRPRRKRAAQQQMTLAQLAETIRGA